MRLDEIGEIADFKLSKGLGNYGFLDDKKIVELTTLRLDLNYMPNKLQSYF